MTAPNGRLADAERIFTAYGSLHLAVAFTDGIEGDAAKRITGAWNRTRPLPGPDFALGLMRRCEGRNPVVVVGASGLIGIDVDGREGLERFREVVGKLPPTVTVTTGKGAHLYFLPPEGAALDKTVFEFGAPSAEAPSGVTAWSEKYLVAPPAVHPSGRIYHFNDGRAPWEIELAELPVEALEAMRHAAGERRSRNGAGPEAGDPIPPGGRNTHLFKLGCAMRRRGSPEAVILAALRAENEARCRPPLGDEEVTKVAESVAERYDAKEENEPPVVARIVSLREFAEVKEEAAEPLVGSAGNAVLPAGGALLFWGTGGDGKTTVEIDLLVHLGEGTDWHGLEIPRSCRVLMIENEGPRHELRGKIERRLAAWDGPDAADHVFIWEEPWAGFSFATEAHRDQLVAFCKERHINVIAAGPVWNIGMSGPGTLEEIGAFMKLIAAVRAELDHPLAVILVHHDNRQGTVSGAWEGIPDTVAHVVGMGPGATRVTWDKVRWGSALHGRTWKLVWREGESYELDETPEVTDDEIRESVLAIVAANPGCSSKKIEDEGKGSRARIRGIRDELLKKGILENRGKGGPGGTGGGGMKLYLVPEEDRSPGGGERSANASPPTSEPSESRRSPFAAPKEANASGGARSNDPDDNWCAGCERVLNATYPGEPFCHCQDEADEFAERFGGAS